MNHGVDEQGVLRIAKLARLALNDSDAKRFAPQLSGVLSFMKRLESVDGLNAGGSTVQPENRLSDDVPGCMMSNDELIRIAPMNDGPFIRVPKVIDDGGSS